MHPSDDHERIEALLRQLTAASAPDAWLPLLEGLVGLLGDHFAREEDTDGVYERASHDHAQVDLALRGLRQDHRDLLALAGTLRDQAEELQRAQAAFVARLGLLAAALKRHELAETAITRPTATADHPNSVK